MLKVRADLLRIAMRFVSLEETRLYLTGVHIEPSDSGVILVATDGHRLICIHDRDGEADKAMTLRLDGRALGLCEPRSTIAMTDGIPVAMVGGQTLDLFGDETVVPGPFPDWRRLTIKKPFTGTATPAFSGRYVADFVRAGEQLLRAFIHPVKEPDDDDSMSGDDEEETRPNFYLVIRPNDDPSGPSLIRWVLSGAPCDEAFGLLMPVREDRPLSTLPDFAKAKEPA